MDEYNERPQGQPLPEEAPEGAVSGAPAEPVGETEETGEAKKPRRPGAGLYEWLQLVMGCVLAAVVLFNCFARLTRVDGHSMDPTLQDGEMMLIWSLGYQPEQGDIVVLTKTAQDTLPQVKDKAIVKRVIAVEGQTVDIDYTTGTVYVDGEALDEPYLNEPMEEPWYEDLTSVTVPEGSVFVMGDNRNHSNDSRDVTLGTVDERYVLGRAVCVLLPFQNFGMIPEGEQTR